MSKSTVAAKAPITIANVDNKPSLDDLCRERNYLHSH